MSEQRGMQQTVIKERDNYEKNIIRTVDKRCPWIIAGKCWKLLLFPLKYNAFEASMYCSSLKNNNNDNDNSKLELAATGEKFEELNIKRGYVLGRQSFIHAFAMALILLSTIPKKDES